MALGAPVLPEVALGTEEVHHGLAHSPPLVSELNTETRDIYFYAFRYVRERNKPLRFFMAKPYLSMLVNILAAIHQTTGFIAVLLLGLSIYVLASDWGGLDPSFFTDIGVCSLLFSIIVLMLSCLGWASVSRLIQRYSLPGDLPEPPIHYVGRLVLIYCTRRVLMYLYIFLMIVYMGAELYVLAHSFNALFSFNATKSTLAPQATNATLISHATVPTATFSDLEASLATRFNTFFFGATESCTNPNFGWWWDWVGQHCGKALQLDINSCVNCQGTLMTYCSADAATCWADASSPSYNQGPTCPFSICRVSITNYMISQIGPFVYTMVAVLVSQATVLGLTLVLVAWDHAWSDKVVAEGGGGGGGGGGDEGLVGGVEMGAGGAGGAGVLEERERVKTRVPARAGLAGLPFMQGLVRSGGIEAIEGAVAAAAAAPSMPHSQPQPQPLPRRGLFGRTLGSRSDSGNGSGRSRGSGSGGSWREAVSRSFRGRTPEEEEEEMVRRAIALSLQHQNQQQQEQQEQQQEHHHRQSNTVRVDADGWQEGGLDDDDEAGGEDVAGDYPGDGDWQESGNDGSERVTGGVEAGVGAGARNLAGAVVNAVGSGLGMLEGLAMRVLPVGGTSHDPEDGHENEPQPAHK